jgi:hypothetical protein
MRLTPTEQQVIREASLRWFGVRPRLFGSRLDDLKLGGTTGRDLAMSYLSGKPKDFIAPPWAFN